jgi:KaiC/GvpD/RAD55 family RecA-like ATPase
LVTEETIVQLANVSAVSAGFIAAIVAYMFTANTYKKFVKFILLGVFFFVLSTVLFVVSVLPDFQAFSNPNTIENASAIIFVGGWVYVSLIFVFAAFQVELIGMKASIIVTIKWNAEQKFKGKYKEAIPKEKIKLGLLNNVITSEFERGIAILVVSRLHNYLRSFALEILAEGIKANEYGIYVSTNMPYHTVMKGMKGLPLKFSDKIFVVDCYSPIFGFGEKPIVGKEAELHAKDIKTLHECIRKIRKKIGIGKDYNRVRIVYDNLSLMKLSVEKEEIIKYIYHSVPIEKELGWISIFICDEEDERGELEKLLNFMCDCKITIDEKMIKDKQCVCLKVVDLEKKCKWDSNEHVCKEEEDETCCFLTVE